MNLILLASPFFALSIVTEAVDSLKHRQASYQLKDSVSNVGSVLIEELGALPIKALLIFSYCYISQYFPLFTIHTEQVYTWLLLWLGVDCSYYWYHRASHRCTFLWIGHSVHHQSEHYNLSVALRQGFFQTMTSWPFYLPLALIGFPAWMFFIVYPINTIYQFWLHTQKVNKLGWLEKVFNTPSHHRVHHGKNPQYIDKNYGGSLIIWDKLFGTFEPETIPVDYGVTEPLDSWNSFYANIKVVKDVLYYGQYLKSKVQIIQAFFMPPEWIINKINHEGINPAKRNSEKSNAAVPKVYMLLNLAFLLAIYVYLALNFNNQSPLSWGLWCTVFLSIYIQGQISNEAFDIVKLEIIRSILVGVCILLGTQLPSMAVTGAMLFYAINLYFYQSEEATIIDTAT